MYVVVFKLLYTILFPYSRFDDDLKKTTVAQNLTSKIPYINLASK